jgi:hypothetical protein
MPTRFDLEEDDLLDTWNSGWVTDNRRDSRLVFLFGFLDFGKVYLGSYYFTNLMH